MRVAELNLEEGMPTVAEALSILESQFKKYKRDKVGCVVLIHGYGSSGKGGKIALAVRKHLKEMKDQNKVKKVIFGEEFGINVESAELKIKYTKELEEYYCKGNRGITIVEF